MDLIEIMIARGNPPINGCLVLPGEDKSVPATEKAQKQWKPPRMVDPSAVVDVDESALTDVGRLDTDATLYALKEKHEGVTRCHCVLKLPSALQKSSVRPDQAHHTVNIVMVDVSSSMDRYWKGVQDGWNNNVAPHLVGRTIIYTFGSSVTCWGSKSTLDKRFFDGGGTDLTGALQTIINELHLCTEKYVNIFMITDGDHSSTDIEPLQVINVMQRPEKKICNVFILGVGYEFPVQYCIDIRSRLHTGSSNLPSLFWSKDADETEEQMVDIGKRISDGSSYSVQLSLDGYKMPGLKSRRMFHLREWVYFPCEPTVLENLKVIFMSNCGHLSLAVQDMSMDILEEIFSQWNSIILQQHRNGDPISNDVLKLKEKIFKTYLEIVSQGNSKSIQQRLEKKRIKTNEMGFRKQLKEMEMLLTKEKYENQMELVDTILKTTVTKDKYHLRSLQLKGHTDEDYEKDRQDFKQIHAQHSKALQGYTVRPDDCCRITMTSTVNDLQDPDFIELLDESDKFNFLKSFSMTGIPVHAPTRDSVSLNPWTFIVKSILKSPYAIMSQTGMEQFAQIRSTDGEDKVVQLKQDDDNSRYNAVVPVFPPDITNAMKPFVNTRLYTLCVNFATIKNPHIVDFNMHMAALAVTWMTILFENPFKPRPEHARLRMESIEATALLYTDQKRYINYMRTLAEDTARALMTESPKLVENKVIKCETLVKPMFFAYMMKKYDLGVGILDVEKMISLLLMEYVGRCLSNFRSDDTPYTDLFAESLTNQSVRKSWVTNYIENTRKQISGEGHSLLNMYYTLEKVKKEAKIVAYQKEKDLNDDLVTKIPLKVRINEVERMRNVSSAGAVSWRTIKVFAKEMSLEDHVIEDLFSDKSTFVYTAHSLRYKSSIERLNNPMGNYSGVHKFVSGKVQNECSKDVIKMFRKCLISTMEKCWLEAYLDVHSEVVKPMTRQAVINEAQRRGVAVTNETFDQVYKNFRETGLLSNACQIKACPYYLQPHKSYNQHASVERLRGNFKFIHALHSTTYFCKDSDEDVIVQNLKSNSFTKTDHNISEDDVKRLLPQIRTLKSIYQELT